MQYVTIEVENLIIDKRYQRELNEQRVQKIVDEFDPRLLGTLEVSQRKGTKVAVFDGQHRLAALAMCSPRELTSRACFEFAHGPDGRNPAGRKLRGGFFAPSSAKSRFRSAAV